VLELDERPPEGEDPFAWMHDLAGHALEATDADLVVAIGKSLGSAAAPLVSGPAVWLTPLLTRPDIVAALAGTESPALVIGSPDDPSWGEGELPDNPLLDVLELPGLDHSLQVDGDPMASLDVLRTVTQRIGAFLASVSA
jgi:hypothetical protein